MVPGAFVLALVVVAATAQSSMSSEDASSLMAVAKSNSEFTTQLYTALTSNSSDNLIFSPFSLSAVMAMLKAGARDKTADAIQTSMKFPSSDDILNKGYRSLLQSLRSDGENFTLETANKIYTQKGFEINPEYTKTLHDFYDADIKQLDFSQSAVSAQEINTFVSTTTHDKIKDLISPGDLDSLTRLVLVNAIYFKGLWKNQFNKESTRKADFFLDSKQTVKVDMMRIEADFPYGEISELNAKAVALPYQGDRLSMIILLPNEVEGLKDMEEKLKTFDLAGLPSRLHVQKVMVKMPRFKLESTIDLKQPLQDIGAGLIFDQDAADFKGITTAEKLYVSKAVQKAFIEVNEEGSEAAAATGIQISVKSAFDGEYLKADHPFIALIMGSRRSSVSTTVLFSSTCHNPTQETSQFQGRAGGSEVHGSSASTVAANWLPSFLVMPILTILMGPRGI